MSADKIKGVNLGNWLVLEKWMGYEVFEGTDAHDEVWLARDLDADELVRRMKTHRDTYITEDDFVWIAEHGFTHVRIPVPYFVFGDREPFIGCLDYLDKAFDWATAHGLQVLIDLHTVPGSQNGFDNGGLTGVCRWHLMPDEIEFVYTVLERLASRYAHHEALWGIEVLNEPVSEFIFRTSRDYGNARDQAEALGSTFVPVDFLKSFYRECYKRLRPLVPERVAIVFHDGFRLGDWNDFFKQEQMLNVYLDTHIYLSQMEDFVKIHQKWFYRILMFAMGKRVARVNKTIPVITGEWCLENRQVKNMHGDEDGEEKRNAIRELYQKICSMQTGAFEKGAGWFYWSYKLEDKDQNGYLDTWREGWSARLCVEQDWLKL